MNDPAIVVEDVGKAFGKITALEDLDLEVPRGRMFVPLSIWQYRRSV